MCLGMGFAGLPRARLSLTHPTLQRIQIFYESLFFIDVKNRLTLVRFTSRIQKFLFRENTRIHIRPTETRCLSLIQVNTLSFETDGGIETAS